MDTFSVVLENKTKSSTLYAHVTGTGSEGLVMLQADGKTLYHPTSPSKTLQPPGADIAIKVGGPGESKTLTVPRISGGRIWFCEEKPLTFLVNPGPALVEPSATNPADPNYELDWSFCEFTYNQAELYVNVSYVDFVSAPISLKLETESGAVKSVPGLPAGALETVSAKLQEQGQRDGAGWEKLVIRSKDGSRILRALSPNSGAVLKPGLFDGYYQAYVDEVWSKYGGEELRVNSQFKWGDASGRVRGDGLLTFDDVGSFSKPSARDIFSCSTGPFAAGPGVSEHMLNIGARLAAAFNRSTLLVNTEQPEGERIAQYYREPVTNHYARICHETSIESRGYAFPYDDVGSSSAADQSGFINDPKPKVLTVAVGAPL
ncbi:CBM6-containing protein [Stachybotrys elegans]|uniref:CBM6-containing protein n=1 Tax=Stachybotrys elegans TaxID=80388 RepID=A0A8K0SMW8_9HYPO|nr:CBM6-containing protein [Stachybotrys elegans]